MKQHSVATNAVLNIIYKISSLVFPIITYPYVSRILLADGLGKVSFFNSVTSYSMLVGSLGISTYGIRATAKVRDDKKYLSKITKELFNLNTFVTAFVLLFLGISCLFVNKFRSEYLLLIICCAQVAIAPLSMDWLLAGLEQYSYITIRAIVFKIISLCLIFLFIHRKEDYVIYALITAFGFVGNYVCNFFYTRRFVDYKVHSKLEYRKHIKPMLLLFSSALAISVYTNVDTIMLGFINGDRAVGLYDVAVKGKTVLISLINSISGVMLPRMSYYFAEGDNKSFNELLRKNVQVIFGISIPTCMFFILEAKDTVLFLGGSTYVLAAGCMMILMPILIVSSFSNITGNQILVPSGNDSAFMKAVVAGAICDIVLNAAFMPRFSFYGAAAATLVAEIVQATMQGHFAKDYLKGNIDWKTIGKIVTGALISTVLVFILQRFVSFSYIVNLILSALVFALLYLAVLHVVGYRYFEKLLSKFLGQILSKFSRK